MPDESPSKPPASTDPNSLANLLPEYFDDYPASTNPGPGIPPARAGDASAPFEFLPVAVPIRPAPAKAKSGKGNFNYLALGIVAFVGIIIVPLLIFGIFFIIANTEPVQTTINVSQAISPLATVYSITPGANSTPAPTAKGTTGVNATAGSTLAASACPVQTAFGQVPYYGCAKPVQAGSAFTGYFGLAEMQLAQNGQNGPAANRVYAVTTDSPAKVLSFYANLLPAQGYTPAGATTTGSTPLGNYSAALYTKNGQQLQIVALSVNKASPDGQVNSGQTLVRLSSS